MAVHIFSRRKLLKTAGAIAAATTLPKWFVEETLDVLPVPGREEDLHRHFSLELAVVALEDRAHPARADHGEDLVVPDEPGLDAGLDVGRDPGILEHAAILPPGFPPPVNCKIG